MQLVHVGDGILTEFAVGILLQVVTVFFIGCDKLESKRQLCLIDEAR